MSPVRNLSKIINNGYLLRLFKQLIIINVAYQFLLLFFQSQFDHFVGIANLRTNTTHFDLMAFLFCPLIFGAYLDFICRAMMRTVIILGNVGGLLKEQYELSLEENQLLSI